MRSPTLAELRIPGSEVGKIISIALATAVLFVVALLFARANARNQEALGRRWYSRGDQSLQSGNALQSVSDFQSALRYSPDNRQYELRLAQALLSAGRVSEAEAYFLSLWHDEPGNGLVNEELARIAVGKGDRQSAVRYYHGAIFGIWEADSRSKRVAARFELTTYLIESGSVAQADSELIALASEVPEDPSLLSRTGDLFLRIHDYERSLEMYKKSLAQDPRSESSLLGAGMVSYELGRYADARTYLTRAKALSANESIETKLDTIAAIQSIDPLAPGIGYLTHVDRAMRAFEQAGKRLQQCGAIPIDPSVKGNALSGVAIRWNELSPQIKKRSLRRDPDLVDEAIEIALKTEQTANGICREPTVMDIALLKIAAQRNGSKD